ncbi:MULTISPECIES: cytochrome-c oxidase, cbb3-type subunit III [Comamonas]|uniref:Cbb3-type cytochrome c oxidase subunit n=1 Tax=Comamonas thiooxydans TaxID=363952 RepID=A0A096GJY8_9BURK|nr:MULTISPECIES: cytochrome-c oxidase, cbb3-type subunit III [Comamonas]ACY32560.1 cytochrome c oxidase, cbb3-type, subunit III [Comamonas thiooxydans]EFI62768.1 cytochrome c oxidase, cbb3-type, subunit III [Comamonas thiooxydans]KGG82787.1 cytochrome CBB3 [Comamonas thiooxydans]KGG85283.1 cytochrome CBB3 [Comamonas thiooxydans]KGG92930.1 cytochrome CBB3 [Comamonas thiooxydans]
MSDFINNFWSVYVAAITLIGIFGCLLLLILVARKKVVPSGDNTTGHVWDEDLRELNNPMPKWWMGLFVITVVFSLGYLVVYPGLGGFGGKLDWSQTGAYDKEMAKAKADLEPLYAKFTSMPTEEMAKDPQAMAIGERLFMNNCAQCHGSDARGSKSFPNLADGDWLHGGSPEKIRETITNGRIGMMPPMAAAVGSAEDVRNVAHYVLSLSGSPHDAVKASQGKSKFVACAACHGMDGKGNPALGAPNLTDDIWLHGWGEAAIVNIVNNGKHNEMPAQKEKLTEAQIAVLASYVWSLSNTQNQK